MKKIKHLDSYYVTEDAKVFVKVGDELKELKQYSSKTGYLSVRILEPNPHYGRYALVHRLVADAFLERPDTNEKLVVRHLNDDKSNNSLANLAWGTYKENFNDAVQNQKLSRPFGGNHSKIKNEDQNIIRDLLTIGLSTKTIAGFFGVRPETIAKYKYK